MRMRMWSEAIWVGVVGDGGGGGGRWSELVKCGRAEPWPPAGLCLWPATVSQVEHELVVEPALVPDGEPVVVRGMKKQTRGTRLTGPAAKKQKPREAYALQQQVASSFVAPQSRV